MEQLSIRDWMVIIGAMMIAAVLIDAVRRYWRERRAEVRLNARIDRSAPLSDDDDAFNPVSYTHLTLPTNSLV